MIETSVPTIERFSDRMKGILSLRQILERDSAGASHRIVTQEGGDHFLKKPDDHLRRGDDLTGGFFDLVRKKVERLSKVNLKENVLFRHLERGQATPLAEEALYWDIRLPQGHPGLEPKAAKALFDAYDFLHSLPREAHQFFPVFLEGYSVGHGTRVGIYSALLAQRLGDENLPPEVAAQAGFFHDIGKAHPAINQLVSLPRILAKSEYERVKFHPVIGALAWANFLLSKIAPKTDIKTLLQMHDGILEHHVRPDGLGYPSFIEPFRSSLVARVIAVADGFDAMTSHRKYQQHLNFTIDYAREELKRCAGLPWNKEKTRGKRSEEQFNPKLVQMFLELDPRPVFHNPNET